ncbi:hypothetical protein GO986_16315 [Deinococcus sp. HMF7620]|uniref:Uncharacterized protein n=1 Tax=Deinococcus arboris TaxID=2682977 RepID=A0A7C9I4N2_9DEIO|nr:hypothetical protein [Deinococcus arboris]MVN88311.1 hypothetical protein [Deinococcus arboris]
MTVLERLDYALAGENDRRQIESPFDLLIAVRREVLRLQRWEAVGRQLYALDERHRALLAHDERMEDMAAEVRAASGLDFMPNAAYVACGAEFEDLYTQFEHLVQADA